MKMTIDFIGEGMKDILEYLSSLKEENVTIVLDEDMFIESIALCFDKMNISNLNIVKDDEKEHTASFSCSENVESNLIKLCCYLKIFGDCGHTFSLRINEKKLCWDGDGSDRITKINGKHTVPGNKMKDKYTEYKLSKIQENNETIEEVIKRIVDKAFN